MTRLCVSLAALALLASPAAAQKQALSATSPDGKQTASARDQKITIIDTGTQKQLLAIAAHKADITGLAYSPDGKMLGSVDTDGKLILFDVAAGKQVKTIHAPKGATELSFSRDGKTLEVKSPNKNSKFDLATGKQL